jgi:hypothetical protein
VGKISWPVCQFLPAVVGSKLLGALTTTQIVTVHRKNRDTIVSFIP